MITLIDYSQIVISSAVEYNSQTRELISIDLLRHIALQCIQTYKNKFRTNLDQMIICCDGKNYWRKNIFLHYKQNRKKDQDKSSFDWNGFFVLFNAIKEEMKTELPFKVLEVEGCEADDIIAILSQTLCSSEDEIIIVSSDKDLLQIQENICGKVKQWSPYHKKFINYQTNKYNLFEHIVRGDAGDGIPNILSDDDVFVTNDKRMKSLHAKTINKWYESMPDSFTNDPELFSKYIRNKTLIDLRQIPEKQTQDIITAYANITPSKASIFKYLTKYKLRKILERGGF